MTEEEYFEQQQREQQAQDDYLSECGSCPNCHETVHVSDLGSDCGITKCINCYNK